MIDTPHELPPSLASRRTVKRGRAWLFGVIGLLLVSAITVIGIGVFRNNKADSTRSTDARQLASIQQTCQQWSDNSAPSVDGKTASATCIAMSGWMNEQLSGGQKTASMMWASATTMRDTCLQWMGTHSMANSDSTAQSWCDAMVTWMGQHIGNWDSWMGNGTMMG